MNTQRTITTFISLCLLGSTGCSSEEALPRGRTLPGDNGTVMFDGGDTGKGCPGLNRTQPCACGALAGRQTCTAQLAWSACECLMPPDDGAAGMGGGTGGGSVVSDPPANKLAASFDWLR